MLLVPTTIGPSPIHGIGLFAADYIEADSRIWEFNRHVDFVFDESAFAEMSPEAAAQFKKYSYLDPELMKWVLCGDDARYFNHSETPNCQELGTGYGGITVAMRPILRGEEMTIDYRKIHVGELW